MSEAGAAVWTRPRSSAGGRDLCRRRVNAGAALQAELRLGWVLVLAPGTLHAGLQSGSVPSLTRGAEAVKDRLDVTRGAALKSGLP